MKKYICSLMFLLAITAFSASTAFSKAGTPISSVPVGLEGDCGDPPTFHKMATTTDANGKFSFKAEEGNYILRLSTKEIAGRISIDLKDYAVHPDDYEISLVIAGIVGGDGSIFDRWGNLINGKYVEHPLIISEKTSTFSIKILKGGGTLTGTLTYAKKEKANTTIDTIKLTNKLWTDYNLHDPGISTTGNQTQDGGDTQKEKPNNNTQKTLINTTHSNIRHPSKSATLLYVGAGYNNLSKTTKNQAFLSDAAGINLSVYQPVLTRKIITFGIQMGVEYAIGIKDNLPALPNAFHVVGETSSTVAFTSSGGKQSAFKFDAGPQLDIHIGNHFVISPAFLVGGRLNIGLKEFSAVQTTVLSGTSYNYTLLKKTNSKPIDVVLTPKLRLHYMFNNWIGLWVEANYSFLSKIRTDITTLLPLDTPIAGEYNKSQLDDATYPTEQRTTKFGAVGVNAGLVFSFGGKKDKTITVVSPPQPATTIILLYPMDDTEDITAPAAISIVGKPKGENGEVGITNEVDAAGIINEKEMQVPKTANSLNTQVASITVNGSGETTANGLPIVHSKTVSGTIKMLEGISNKGISITIEQKESGDKATAVTDDKGNFSMVLIRDTTHLVYVNGVEYGKIKIISQDENSAKGLILEFHDGGDMDAPQGNCTGRGGCYFSEARIQVNIEKGSKLPGREVAVSFILNKDVLEGEYLTQSDYSSKYFVVGEDIKINPEISEKLGVKSLTILSGKYPIDYSTNKFGSIKLKTSLPK